MIYEALAVVVSIPVILLVLRQGAKMTRIEEVAPPLEEASCTGYEDPYWKDTRRDCQSLRSIVCLDGRCSYHCSKMCRCEASNEPEFMGRPRR